MKAKIFRVCAVLFLLLLFVPGADAKKKRIMQVMGGATVGTMGFIIDASYDPRLDKLVPGYKVINVIIINESFNIIHMDVSRDKWSIKIADKKKTIPAIHSLRSQKPGVWSDLPAKVRNVIGYPLIIPIGGRIVFDLFVPEGYDVSKFNELRAFFRSYNTRFDIMVTQ
ncbi:MAG: hypothetical protein HN337_01030 [Deltaproteobacteria bacterium]|nr:hypothetical protein [Deltaproteobacteria bacterium]